MYRVDNQKMQYSNTALSFPMTDRMHIRPFLRAKHSHLHTSTALTRQSEAVDFLYLYLHSLKRENQKIYVGICTNIFHKSEV